MPQQISLFNEEKEKIDGILKEFLKNSAAKGVIFADLSGVILSKMGFIQKYDINSLTILSANTVTATRQMASIIGESNFKEMVYNGKYQNIYITLLANSGILIAIYDNTTTLGLIRLYADKVIGELESIFAKIKERSEKGAPTLPIEKKPKEEQISGEIEPNKP